ncbi:MAG: ATP-binding protein [Bacteroidales bacterium]|jgi:signal transduction histidine kinase/CheY-like chemotaxis protein
MRFYILVFLFSFILQANFVFAQSDTIETKSLSSVTLTIDSLENLAKSAPVSKKPEYYLQLAHLYRNFNHSRSIDYCRMAIYFGDNAGKTFRVSEAYHMLADIFKMDNQLDSALSYRKKAIQQAEVEEKAKLETLFAGYQAKKQAYKESRSQYLLVTKIVLGFLLALFLVVLGIWLRNIAVNRLLKKKLHEYQTNLKLLSHKVEEFSRQVDSEVAKQIGPLNQKLAKARQRDLDLKKKLKQLEESDYLKNAFLGSMSHDIRTPLNGILGFSSLLETELAVMGNTQLYEYTSNIEQSGIQLTNLLDNIIDISSIEANMVEVAWQLERFDHIVKEVEETYARRAKDKGLVFKVKIDPDLPELKVDGKKLAKVMSLLIDNAVKFTDKGFVTISASYNQQKNRAVIQIKDTGPGIESDILKALLASFQYGPQGKAQIYQGKGIGITLAHRFVRLLGGDFSITSAPQAGTAIILTIPCEGDQVESNVNDFESVSVTAAPELGRLSIFIVEDDRMNRMVLEKMLRTAGKITLAEDGDDALNRIERAHIQGNIFQVMLFDMQLPPPWDGITLMQTVKERIPEYNGVPFIVQTAFAMSGDKDHYISAGFDDYISKPINKTELLTLIQKHIQLKK